MVKGNLNFKRIEEKWQKKWEEEGVFEASPDERKKFYLNFPYPYINAYQHIGHLFTLMRVEAFARYKRLRGFNVLFPQGWHVTGSPIVNAAKRVKEKEPKQIKIMKDMGISGKEIKKFEKPEHWIKFFAPEFKKDYKSIGMSVDWRREFITSEINPHYDKFIRWQFRKLKEKEYCVKGKFPVVWDPIQNSAVGDHDRVEGEGVIPLEFLLVKHKLDEGKFIVSATLRPDTILGITNLYMNPEVEYVEAEVNGEVWIVSEFAAERLAEQDFEVKVIKKISGREFMGLKTEEIDGHLVPILPATFLDPKFGTGLVHSVPSDSADDLIALYDLQKDEETLEKYELDKDEIGSIKPIPVLDTPDLGDIPAQTMLDKYGIKHQNERKKLDEIKEKLYKLSYYTATYNKKYEKFFSKNLYGKKVEKGKALIQEEIISRGWGAVYYTLNEKVVSRGLNECVVKIVDDQWFIDYGNEKWKVDTKKALKKLKLYPEKSRQQFEYVIDWLHEWACTREGGLGTRLPWDEKWLIESLSDSTIYMAYYTIAHKIKEFNIEEIDDSFFDYVFLGKGNGNKEWKELKEEFNYWYPTDFRNSGKDLIQNHLTFYLFNHVAIFPEKHWPAGIGVNGWVTVDGNKMSKSLGNMIPVREMVPKYGADACRTTILNGGEGMDDPNWETSFADSLGGKFLQINNSIEKYYGKGKSGKKGREERLAESRAMSLLKELSSDMDETMFRSAIHKILFGYWKVIRDYVNDTKEEPNKVVFDTLVRDFLVILSPFAPHICEEIWEKIGGKGFVSEADWPKIDEKKIDKRLEESAKIVDKTVSDILNILKIVKKGEKVYLYVIPNELENYDGERIGARVGKRVEVFAVNDKKKYDPEGKSKKARPGKPAIFVE